MTNLPGAQTRPGLGSEGLRAMGGHRAPSVVFGDGSTHPVLLAATRREDETLRKSPSRAISVRWKGQVGCIFKPGVRMGFEISSWPGLSHRP